MRVIDFSAQNNARLQYMQKMLGTGGGSALNNFFKNQEAMRLKREALGSLEATRAGQLDIGQQKADVLKQRLQEEIPGFRLKEENYRSLIDLHGAQLTKANVEAKLAAAGIPLKEAQTVAARMHALLYNAQTAKAKAETGLAAARTATEQEKAGATKDWRINEQNKALTQNARNIYNMAVAQVVGGNKQILTPANADRVEAAGQVLFGKDFKLDRDANGNWTPDMKKIAGTTLDKDGNPKGDFLKNVAQANKPSSPFEALVRNAQEAEAAGNTEGAKYYMQKIFKEVAPTVSQTQGAVLQRLASQGRMDDFNKLLTEWRSAGKGGGAGGQATQTRLGNIDATLSILDTIEGSVDKTFSNSPALVNSQYQNMSAWAKAHWKGDPDAQLLMDLPSYRATIARGVGDVGRLSVQEEANVQKALPNLSSDTQQQAHAKIANMRRILKNMRNSFAGNDPNTTRIIAQDLARRAAAGLPLEDVAAWDPGTPKDKAAPTPPSGDDIKGLDATKSSIENTQAQIADLRKSGAFPDSKMTWNELLGAVGPSNDNVVAAGKTLNGAVGDYQRNVMPHATNDTEINDLNSVSIDPAKDNLDTIVQKLDAMHDRVDRTSRSLGGVALTHGVDHGVEEPIKPTDHVDAFGPPDPNIPAGHRMDDAANRQKGIDAIGNSAVKNGQKIGGPEEKRDKAADQYRRELDPALQPFFDKLTPEQQQRVMSGVD